MYRDDMKPDRLRELVARSVWLHLAKLNASGLVLDESTAARLTELSIAYPQWHLAANESDEFSHWTSGTGDPDYEESQDVEIAPRKRRVLVQWLRLPSPKHRPFYEDTWRDVCRTRFSCSLCALCDLARDGVWPTDRWREALHTWAEEGMVLRSWRYAAPLVKTMPDDTLQETIHAVTWWMKAASKATDRHEDVLLDLCGRALRLPLDGGTGIESNGNPIDKPVTKAINHPIGHVTQALINLWLKGEPNDNDLLSAKIRPIFTQICDVQIDRLRHGRVLLGAHLIALFRVDRLWTAQYLLPLFAWSNPAEAKAVWEGFLWSPRLYQPLLTAFKTQFLETANHYAELGAHRQRFAAFLTYMSLSSTEGYSMGEFRSAIGALPQAGLESCARALAQALEGAADQREDYWRNRVQPFWQQVWPRFRGLANPQIAESLIGLAIAARGEFPAAVAAVRYWLQPIEYPDYVVRLLYESGLCKRFPAEALLLLTTAIDEQSRVPQKIGNCLDQIAEAAPNLAQDVPYRRLREYARTGGN
jgi:hypothetical protein